MKGEMKFPAVEESHQAVEGFCFCLRFFEIEIEVGEVEESLAFLVELLGNGRVGQASFRFGGEDGI